MSKKKIEKLLLRSLYVILSLLLTDFFLVYFFGQEVLGRILLWPIICITFVPLMLFPFTFEIKGKTSGEYSEKEREERLIVYVMPWIWGLLIAVMIYLMGWSQTLGLISQIGNEENYEKVVAQIHYPSITPGISLVFSSVDLKLEDGSVLKEVGFPIPTRTTPNTLYELTLTPNMRTILDVD